MAVQTKLRGRGVHVQQELCGQGMQSATPDGTWQLAIGMALQGLPLAARVCTSTWRACLLPIMLQVKSWQDPVISQFMEMGVGRQQAALGAAYVAFANTNQSEVRCMFGGVWP